MYASKYSAAGIFGTVFFGSNSFFRLPTGRTIPLRAYEIKMPGGRLKVFNFKILYHALNQEIQNCVSPILCSYMGYSEGRNFILKNNKKRKKK